MFWVMKVHHQEVSGRIQALWYNVMSKCIWYYGESSVCVIRWSTHKAVEAVWWLGEWSLLS